MRRPEVLVLELLTSSRGSGWYDRHVKLPNFSGIMAQVVAVWCQELGATVSYRTFTGNEPLESLVAGSWDVVFISSYTRTAWAAYAIARHFDRRGTVTVLGGPHAHAWPEDARRFFDYVVGTTDRELLARILEERRRATDGHGEWLEASRPLKALPGLRQRAQFLDLALRKARLVASVPLLSSLGCPYSCAFCSDADSVFHQLESAAIEDDVGFARKAFPGGLLFWHDPSFGVRFDATLGAIERALDGRSLRLGAQTPLALLSSGRIQRMAQAGFVALLPGVEGWQEPDPKLGQGRATGRDRLEATVGQIEELLRLIPYVQVNFIAGLDDETGESFELTREFVDRLPGVWPNYNLITAYGAASPLSRGLAREGRILPVPFPLLDQKTCPNVRYSARSLSTLFGRLVQLAEFSFGPSLALRRVRAGRGWRVRLINLLRARGNDQRRRLKWYRQMASWLATDRDFQRFFEGEGTRLPGPLREAAIARLGPFRALLTATELSDLKAGPVQWTRRAFGEPVGQPRAVRLPPAAS